MPDWLLVIITTILSGGAAAGLIEYFARKSDRTVSESEKIRDELWRELNTQRISLETLRKDLDSWKEQYFQQYSRNLGLQRDIYDLLNEIHDIEIYLINKNIETEGMFTVIRRIKEKIDERTSGDKEKSG